MRKFIPILSLIVVFGVLLTGCDRALQTVNPMLGETIKDEEYAMDPPLEERAAHRNTGDCISNVIVSNGSGLRTLKHCLIQQEGITDPEELKEIEGITSSTELLDLIEKRRGITDPEEEESSE